MFLALFSDLGMANNPKSKAAVLNLLPLCFCHETRFLLYINVFMNNFLKIPFISRPALHLQPTSL